MNTIRPPARSDASSSDRGNYDPDRWTRRWSLVLGVPLILLFFVPVWLPADVRDDATTGWTWGWMIGSAKQGWRLIREFLPPALGMLAVGAGLSSSTRGRRTLLSVAGLAVVLRDVGDAVNDSIRRSAGSRTIEGDPRTPLALTLALAAVVASNHVRRRHPKDRAARGWQVGSGFTLLLTVVASVALGQVWFGRYWLVRTTVIMRWIVPAAAVFYGAMSMFDAIDRRETDRRSRFLSLVGRAALGGGPLLVATSLREAMDDLGSQSVVFAWDLGPSLPALLSMAAQSFCHEFGPVALVALAVAAWIRPSTSSSNRPSEARDGERQERDYECGDGGGV